MTQTRHSRAEPDESARRNPLVTDGGEEEETDDEQSADDEEESDAANDTDEGGGEDEAQILYLDLEGLFLDLLGLEVELDEVELDVTAVSGDNNLLGNLLDAVAGLLDGDLGMLPDLDLSGKIQNGMSAVADSAGESLSSVFDELEAPIQELMSQLIRGVVEQLLDGADSSEGSGSASES